MLTIILLGVLVALIGLALHVLVFHYLARLFKFERVSWLKSLLFVVIYFAAISFFNFLINGLFLWLKWEAAAPWVMVVPVLGIFFLMIWKFFNAPWGKAILFYFVFTLISLAVVFLVTLTTRYFALEPYYMVNDSMSPNLQENEYILINKFDRFVKQGDVVAYKSNGPVLIQRVIGVSGDKVEISKSKIYVNNILLKEEAYLEDGTETPIEVLSTVGKGQLYVLPDKRSLLENLAPDRFGIMDKKQMIGSFWLSADFLQPEAQE